MVVGNDHLHAQSAGMRNAIDTGDAIIDSDQQIRFAFGILCD